MIAVKALAFSILTLASLQNGHPIASFRNHPRGAEGRATQLAEMFIEASQVYSVDVFLLTSLAWSESAFDGTRVGAFGELGLLQLHPRTFAGRAYKRYRGLGQADRDRLSIHLGADALRHGFMVCGRSVSMAIAFYKSGRCLRNGPAAQRVIAIRWRLLRAAGET